MIIVHPPLLAYMSDISELPRPLIALSALPDKTKISSSHQPRKNQSSEQSIEFIIYDNILSVKKI